MNKLLTSLFLITSVFSCLTASSNESESGMPEVEYSLIALEKVYSKLYEGGIYENHRKQAQNFIASFSGSSSLSPLEQKIADLIASELPGTTIETAFHQAELMSLIRRTASETAAPSSFLDEFIYWLFTEPDLQKKSAQFLAVRYGLDAVQASLVYDQDRYHFMENSYAYLSALELPPNTNVGEEYANDPLLYGDMPSFQFNWNNAKRSKVMRIPNMARDYMVITENGLKPASTINEEFFHYLKVLKSKNQRQLYINLMAREEDSKTSQIESLDVHSEVGESIVVITIDRSKRSDLYMQNGIYEQMDDAAAFKEAFYKLMVDPKSEFYWSNKINLVEWSKQLQSILAEVHSRYFNSQTTLTRNERIEFIELTHVKIVNALVELINPDFINISCKQTVDRGPSLYTMVFADQLLNQGKEIHENYYDILLKLFTPTAVYHNRNGHFFRILRFDGTLNRLVRHSRHNAPIVP